MSNVTLCVGEIKEENYKHFTRRQIRAQTNKSMQYLNNIILTNDQALNNLTTDVVHYNFDKSDLGGLYRGTSWIRTQKMTGHCNHAKTLEDIQVTQKYLSKLREHINDFVHALNSDTLESEWFPLVTISDSIIGYRVERVSVPQKMMCPECGTFIMSKNLKSHQESQSCKHDRVRFKLRKNGWDMVDSMGALGQAVFDGTIKGGKVIPLNYEIWVPPWMAKAESLWRRGQYAGMTLVEFMNKLFLEKQNEGTSTNQGS